MKPYPIPDRRQHPRVEGMVVTQPGDLDSSPIHILTPEQLSVPGEAGNVWFVGTEPNADETVKDTGWPLTPREVASFWLWVIGASCLCVGLTLLAAGYAAGLSTGDIIASLLAWGGV